MPDEPSYEQHLELYRSVASDVAHDLNNLLLLISGYTEILSKNLDDREQVVQIVQKIQTATAGVRQLTEKLQSIGQATDDGATNLPSAHLEDVPSPSQAHHEEVRIFVAVAGEELREFVSRVLTRSGFDVLEIVDEDSVSHIYRSAGQSTNVLIVDIDPTQSSGLETSGLLPGALPDVPTLFLVGDESEIPDFVASLNFSSLVKPFLPSQLVGAVEVLYVQSKR